MPKPCSQCREPRDRPGRYCRACHAAYMREWRKTHPLMGLARFKDGVRHHAGMALRRGQIKPELCFDCGSGLAEMHHPSYLYPLAVEWMCRECHLKHHKDLAASPR